jgi:predicted ATPase
LGVKCRKKETYVDNNNAQLCKRRDGKMTIDLMLKMHKIKNIKEFSYNFKFKNGIYALVGENSVGKSTIMSALASTVYPKTLLKLGKTEVSDDSYIEISSLDKTDMWRYNTQLEQMKSNPACVVFNGIYEGSIFSGTRFEDMQSIDKTINDNPDFVSEFVPASDDLKSALSIILHNEQGHYNNLYKLKNMDVATKYQLNNMPYFYQLDDGKYISKYKMSSGECMLISLLNFINSTALKPEYLRNRKRVLSKQLFVFIDEVELALHPSSIIRLVNYLEKMINSRDMTVVFSTHSSELIKKIIPQNIFYLQNNNGHAYLECPCYPHFAIRSLYDHDGYDSTILVEDELAEIVVRKLTNDFRIKNNLLINVLPVGAWSNTLSFQQRCIEQNAFGVDKFIFSIIDGDVINDVNKAKQYENVKKLFLPIKSIEKYFYDKLILNLDKEFIKVIGNKYFTLTPLDVIVKDFKNNGKGEYDKTGKALFEHLLFHLSKLGYTRKDFIKSFCEDLFQLEDFTNLKTNIENFIQENFNIVNR